MKLNAAFSAADMVICKATTTEWGLNELLSQLTQPTAIYKDIDTLVKGMTSILKAGDHVITMSNLGFDGIHNKLMEEIIRNHDNCT